MEIYHSIRPFKIGSPETFTGQVWLSPPFPGEEESPWQMRIVHFSPGSRSRWHSHTWGQTLHVVSGVGLVQVKGQEIVEIRAGDTIYSPPGEFHWHGAAPGHFMSHIAIAGRPPSPDVAAIGYGEKVSDEEYNRYRP